MTIKKGQKNTQNIIEKKIKQFERNNPELLKALELFDLSMSHYENSLRSIQPTRTITSNSTKVLE